MLLGLVDSGKSVLTDLIAGGGGGGGGGGMIAVEK